MSYNIDCSDTLVGDHIVLILLRVRHLVNFDVVAEAALPSLILWSFAFHHELVFDILLVHALNHRISMVLLRMMLLAILDRSTLAGPFVIRAS